MNQWKVILAALVIFGAGVLTGGLTVRLKNRLKLPRSLPIYRLQAIRSPQQADAALRELMRRMDRQLDLKPDQRQRIRRIFRQSQIRTHQLWEQIAPQVRAELRRTRSEVRAQLNHRQKETFDRLIGKRTARERSAPKPRRPRATPRRRPSSTNRPADTLESPR